MCLEVVFGGIMKEKYRQRRSELGNVFFAIFGAVALVGLLGAAIMTFMKGPLSTSVRLTKMNTAENQMTIGAQVAVMATASQANSGDCDSDLYVEPMEWRAATTEPHPVNGGLVPLGLGISKKDPWGTEYGYCVWNHGAVTSGSGCAANMLTGANSSAYPVVALVSAGPDKTFTSTCRTFAVADANSDGDLSDAGDSPLVSKASENDDDIIFAYTYQEATAASGGLWSLKSGDPTTATISKKIEATGTASLRGGVLLPDKSLVLCDASTAGVMAMNGNAIEICDGAGNWTAITGGGGGGGGTGLVLTPNASSGMDITAPCGSSTCYSSNVTFTLTNNYTVASDTLAVTLSNTSNFEKVSDNCNGNSIAAAASCQVVVRAKATGNKYYTGTLNVVGNNSPFATLDGTSSGFSCSVGGDAPGGKYAACNIGGYNLITTPSGCSASPSNPTCAGGADTYTTSAISMAASFLTGCCSSNGQQNTANMAAYSGGAYTFPAALWCDNLDYQGYTDWFLPSSAELSGYFYPNKAILGSAASGFYSSSTEANLTTPTLYTISIITGGATITAGTTNTYVRCMRWDPAKAVSPATDTTPNTVTFTPSSSTVSAETRTSNMITVYGVTGNVPLSITGGTNAKFSKNGGGYTSTATTVTNGDTVTLEATSPIVGQQDTVSLTIGGSSFNWYVRTVANNTIYAFVTSSTRTGAMPSLAAADTACNSEASSAGLGGSWIAVLAPSSSTNDGPLSRAPWNWTTLKNMNNQVVATSFDDFSDGTISNPINRTAANALAPATYAWTGASSASGLLSGSTSSNPCVNWTSASASYSAYVGVINSTTSHFYYSTGAQTCNNTYAMYCMQDPGSSLIDTNPADVSIRPGIAYSSGAAATSNTVTVTSILQPVTVSISPSAGTADIIINGVSQGAATATAYPNSTVQFSLTVPTTLGTKNTATLQIGDDTYNWWVGYADSAKTLKIFLALVSSHGGFGGLSSADAKCNAAASSSSLGLSSNWKAILSDSGTNAVDRLPWSWGTLKSVSGTTIVDGGYNDLWDGTLDSGINVDANGTPVTGNVWTGTSIEGIKYNAAGSTDSQYYNTNWATSGVGTAIYGSIGSTSGQWINMGTYAAGYVGLYLYCMEDSDATTPDTTPDKLKIPYVVQVPTLSRTSSVPVNVGGMSIGASATVSVTAPSGNPKFTVNGGAEVSSASVTNGDTLIFKMDAPATGNTSNKMTVNVNGSFQTFWRVWTGDTTGTIVKRVFVTRASTNVYTTLSTSPYSPPFGSTGADSVCSSEASAAALGGTWKAIVSAAAGNESDWAVNRIGYNWSELQLVNGTTVAYAGGLWQTTNSPLLNAIVKDPTGANVVSGNVWTATHANGLPYAFYDSASTCSDYTYYGTDKYAYYGSSTAVNSNWTIYGMSNCTGVGRLYCIEQ